MVTLVEADINATEDESDEHQEFVEGDPQVALEVLHEEVSKNVANEPHPPTVSLVPIRLRICRANILGYFGDWGMLLISAAEGVWMVTLLR